MLIPIEFNTSTTNGSSWLVSDFPDAQAREYSSDIIITIKFSNNFQLTNPTKATQKTILEFLHTAKVTPLQG
jgi:hypothetical protein